MPALSAWEQLTCFVIHYAISLVKGHTGEHLDDFSSEISSEVSVSHCTLLSSHSWDLSGSFSSLEADDLGDEDYYKSMHHIHDFLQAIA